jgi:hypothetical protein
MLWVTTWRAQCGLVSSTIQTVGHCVAVYWLLVSSAACSRKLLLAIERKQSSSFLSATTRQNALHAHAQVACSPSESHGMSPCKPLQHTWKLRRPGAVTIRPSSRLSTP